MKKSGPWAEPNYHLCDRYLPYARGGRYVITWDLVQYIVRNRDLLQVYNSEDVSLGMSTQHSVWGRMRWRWKSFKSCRIKAKIPIFTC